MIETSQTTTAPQKKRVILALIAGVTYGLLLRVGFEVSFLNKYLQIVSNAFLIVAPFSVGAVSVLIGAGDRKITGGQVISLSVSAMAFFLIAMFLCLLEGLICLVLVAPVFLIAALFGGLLGGWIHNHFRVSKATLSSFVFLPLLLSPIEANLPPQESEQTVRTTIQIQASPSEVFEHLVNAKNISSNELGFSFVHLIGLPKPLEASMNGSGDGAVRTSRWEKNVSFQEVITKWDKPLALHYQFQIPVGSIPRDALDRHVEMGGEYFTVLDGGYDLVAKDGGTELTLSTRFLNKSQLKIYGDLWGRMVLADFHRSILGLMKNRAERAQNVALH